MTFARALLRRVVIFALETDPLDAEWELRRRLNRIEKWAWIDRLSQAEIDEARREWWTGQ